VFTMTCNLSAHSDCDVLQEEKGENVQNEEETESKKKSLCDLEHVAESEQVPRRQAQREDIQSMERIGR